MSQSLEFTGERFTPECVREIWYEHIHRYALAASLISGKTVLDAACGEGYGAAHLSSLAKSVHAVDISEKAVTHAQERYRAENLQFQVADCCALPFADGQFDCVVSFETLEHLENQATLLQEFRRVLAADGFLIISSPDKAVYTDRYQNQNEFHVKELYRDELDDLLATRFPIRRFMKQKSMFHSVIWPDEEQPGVNFQQSGPQGITEQCVPTRDAMYFIVLCAGSEEALPELRSGSWLFDDEAESVYEHYHHEIRKNMSTGAVLQSMEAELKELRAQLQGPSTAEPKPTPWWRRLFRGD